MNSLQTLRVCLRSLALLTIFLCGARYAAGATETLFTTQVPQQPNVRDTNHELGTKLTTSLGGHIIAIRFWKSAKETGRHVGHIWSVSGQLLASVNFVNETASGWQQQSLATPLAVNPNTVYVVTVNTGNAYYVSTPYGLATKIVNNDLSSVVGTDGVTGAPGLFPTESYKSSNYFRDVVFMPTTPVTQGLLTSNPVSLNLGNVNVGASNSQTLTLANTSSASLSISKVALTGAGFSASGITLPLSLAAGKQVSLNVTFAPSSMGAATGSITITSNASNPNLTVALSGVGMMPQVAAVPASVAFGSVPVGVSNTQTLTLRDSGNTNLIISQATITGTGFSISGSALPVTVTPGNSIALTVRFSPGVAGNAAAMVGIASNAGPLSVPVTGTGISQSLSLSANPSALAFGNASPGSSSKQAVTLTNTGNSSISLSKLTLAGNYFSLGGLALPVTLGAGQSSGFSVTFAPTTAGTFSGSVSVASTAANSPLSIPLSGTGAAPHYVTLSWTPSVSAVSGYSVYRGTQKGGPYTKITSSLVAGSTYNDTNVQSGLTYYYVATAVASDGMQSAFSSEISATIP